MRLLAAATAPSVTSTVQSDTVTPLALNCNASDGLSDKS